MAHVSVAEQILLLALSAVYLAITMVGVHHLYSYKENRHVYYSMNMHFKRDESFYVSQGYMHHVNWLVVNQTSVETIVQHVERGLARLKTCSIKSS